MRLVGSIIILLAIADSRAQKYFYNPDTLTYGDAVDACGLKQMVLAEPKSDPLWMEQVTYIENNVPIADQDLFWIGMTRTGLGPWYWGTGGLASWTFWDADEPSAAADEECCLVMFDALGWAALGCESVLPSLCQDEGATTTTSTTTTTAASTAATTQTASESSNTEGLYRLMRKDFLPNVGLLKTIAVGGSIGCGIECLTQHCVLFVVQAGTTCRIYDDSALVTQADWTKKEGVLAYSK